MAYISHSCSSNAFKSIFCCGPCLRLTLSRLLSVCNTFKKISFLFSLCFPSYNIPKSTETNFHFSLPDYLPLRYRSNPADGSVMKSKTDTRSRHLYRTTTSTTLPPPHPPGTTPPAEVLRSQWDVAWRSYGPSWAYRRRPAPLPIARLAASCPCRQRNRPRSYLLSSHRNLRGACRR